MNVVIYEGELDRIAGWATEYPNLETGGEFFGFFTRSGAPVVQLVLGPAPNSIHNQTSFYQNVGFLVEAGKLLRTTHGLQHLGGWHSHHQMSLAKPSIGDENTVVNALEFHQLPNFLLGITNLHRQGESGRGFEVNLGGFLFDRGRAGYQECHWVVLPGESPIRPSLQSLNSEFLVDPRFCLDWKVKRSSLEAEAVVTTAPAEISDRVWYNHPDGLALLKSIYKQFTIRFQPCEMNRTADEEIYFTFKYEREQWRVELPNDFPQSPCAIYSTNATTDRSYLDLGAGTELFTTVADFLNKYNKELV